MKKNLSKYDDEIDLTEIIKTFWDDKVKILLIIFISILIGVSLNGRDQVSFEGFLEIKEGRNSEFDVFYSVGRFLDDYNYESFPNVGYDSDSNKKIDYNFYDIDSKKSLEEFIKLFLKYDQLISVLEKIPSIKNEISKLSKSDQQIKLFEYAQFFTVEYNSQEKPQTYKLKFKWHNLNEVREILAQTLKFLQKDYTNIILDDLERITEIKKNFSIQRNLARIKYLEEQALIAKELGIIESNTIGVSDDKKKIINLYPSGSLNSNVDYYLRGSKLINKEISLIKNRKYGEYTQIFDEINNLRNIAEINWVEYNMFLLKINPVKHSSNILKISIILGIIFAFFYSIISTTQKNKKKRFDKKKTN